MGYSSESFYAGGSTNFDSEYGGYVGYSMNTATLGFPGSPQTANQIGEAVNAIKQGTKVFEVSMLGVQDADQTIPKQHFDEMRALMKLTGVKPSLHGPVMDPAGFGQRGWEGEEGRKDNERKMFDAIEKAHMLDPKGNTPIVFHSSNGTPGSEYVPGGKGEDKFKEKKASIINKESKQVNQVEEHRTYYLNTSDKDFKRAEKYGDMDEGGTLLTPEDAIRSQNETEWDERLKEIAHGKKYADEAFDRAMGNARALELTNMEVKTEEDRKKFHIMKESDSSLSAEFNKASLLLDNNHTSFRALFNRAYKYGSDDQKKRLRDMSERWQKDRKEKLIENDDRNEFKIQIAQSQLQDHYFGELMHITAQRAKKENGKIIFDDSSGAPKVYENAEKFAMDKAAKTFGNLASKSYDQFGDTAPVIAVENLFPGFAYTKTEDLKKLIDKSRDGFKKYLMKEKKMREGKAEKIAKKHIGVTWDVGHLNVLKKKGFTDKDLIEETKKIAPYVKHVHLTDNFGYSDSHLALGMGNVPLKGILEELEKTGRLDEMRKIVESGGFVQHFKKSPHPLALASLNGGMYGLGAGANWSSAMDTHGAYFGGYGTTNPEIHHTYFGAGFTTMPTEMGGQMPGGASRFGGTPMA